MNGNVVVSTLERVIHFLINQRSLDLGSLGLMTVLNSRFSHHILHVSQRLAKVALINHIVSICSSLVVKTNVPALV